MSEHGDAFLIRRYQRLMALTSDLPTTLELDELLGRISHSAAELCQAQAASILLYDEGREELFFAYTTNLDEVTLRGVTVPVVGSIAGWVVSNRRPLNVARAAQDPRHYKSIDRLTHLTTDSLLGVPLIARDQVVGVLEVLNKLDGEFDQDDEELLVTLGAQAAVAIQNARLFHQSDLVAEMIHELRAPLGSLITAVNLLDNPQVEPELRKEIARIIQDEAQRLNEMTTSFLDLARLESGRARFEACLFPLEPLLRDCIRLATPRAAEREISIDLQLPPDLPRLKADRSMLKQVMLNLLSNATKYNRHAGHIMVRASVQPSPYSLGGMEMQIVVADSGMGIAPEAQARLFQRFYRVPGVERSIQGTGLGLLICKRIVEAHAGRIEMSSGPGSGTEFRVSIPLPESDTGPEYPP